MKNEIRIYGPIGSYPAISAEEIADQLPEDIKEATVRINSPGGSVADGLAIYNYLRDHPAKITTIVDGFAASAASIVMLAGDNRIVHKGSIVMVHNPWTMAAGNADEMRQTAEALDEITSAMYDIYEARTGQSKETIKSMLDGETYLKGTTALEMGFADEIMQETEQNKMAAFADFVNLCRNAKEYTMEDQEKQEQEEIVAVTLDADTINAAIEEATAGIKAEIEGVKSELAEKAEALEGAQAELADAKTELASQAEQIAEISAERDKLADGLKDPAFIDAAMKAVDGAEPSISDAEIDEQEVKAQSNESLTPHWDKYNSLQGAEQTAYWKAHKKQMEAEQKALATA